MCSAETMPRELGLVRGMWVGRAAALGGARRVRLEKPLA
jgi:hypothetical protein